MYTEIIQIRMVALILFGTFIIRLFPMLIILLGAENTMGGTPEAIKNVVGQAYAIRAFSYYYLAQLFQQTYVGHEQKPGIPLYNEPTVAGLDW